MKEVTKVVIVEDHTLMRKGLVTLVESFSDYEIMFDARDGEELMNKLSPNNLPDLVLLDINMPNMDGYATASWINRHFPDVKLLAVSMYDTEAAIIRMFKAGVKGYIMKYCEPTDLKHAMDALIQKGYYYSEVVTGKLIHTINMEEEESGYFPSNPLNKLSDREMEFLQYACTEMTYKEIASAMYLSPRTIDGYRDALFEKLKLKTRVGLVTFAIRNGIVMM
ncbi:response regulator transcription factor [Flavihumibacter rivuli]|uniref:response regulator transcription factor n=1 Tax=Flavihumibacter rivuli TaxID=2838156 RepID=UPI001BDF00C0|nr:response regulator transcription factor [Flavihumibacter rivuli]ULQ56186.1 response regulator transcription factor [Flavihumibacter rivuli]